MPRAPLAHSAAGLPAISARPCHARPSRTARPVCPQSVRGDATRAPRAQRGRFVRNQRTAMPRAPLAHSAAALSAISARPCHERPSRTARPLCPQLAHGAPGNSLRARERRPNFCIFCVRETRGRTHCLNMRTFLLAFALLCSAAARQRPAPLPQPHQRAALGAAPAKRISDAQIEATLRAKMLKSKIGADKFQFHAQGGVVTIEGKTDVIQHKGAATRMAKSAGAAAVVNHIRISDAAKQRAAANLATGRRRAQVRRGDPRSATTASNSQGSTVPRSSADRKSSSGSSQNR